MFRPAVNDRDDLWSPQVQKVLESNALRPSVIVDFLSEGDISVARTLHLDQFFSVQRLHGFRQVVQHVQLHVEKYD